MWEELGISGGTALVLLTALYFVIKWGVKNGIAAYFEEKKDKEEEPQAKPSSPGEGGV